MSRNDATDDNAGSSPSGDSSTSPGSSPTDDSEQSEPSSTDETVDTAGPSPETDPAQSEGMSEDGDNGPPSEDDRMADVRAFPWLRGVAAGAVAWITGYVLMAALFYVGPASIDAASTEGRLEQIGFVFYNAQFVDAVVSAPPEVVVPGGRRLNFVLDAADPAVPVAVYLAIPIVAILAVAAGVSFLLLDLDGVDTDAGLLGVAMAIGYVVVAVAGTFLVLRTTGDGVATFAPDRLRTVAFGFAYPFVLGSLGALAGSLFDRE